MAALRGSYRKGQYLHRFVYTITIASDSGFGIFSFDGFQPPLNDYDINIIPYSGDAGGITLFHYHRQISRSGNRFAASLFYSQTSFASLAATHSGVYVIELLIGSR